MAVRAVSQPAQPLPISIRSHIRTYSLSLEVQTSKGNYLLDYLTYLNVRMDDVDFDRGNNSAHNMDDLILKTASWQDDY